MKTIIKDQLTQKDFQGLDPDTLHRFVFIDEGEARARQLFFFDGSSRVEVRIIKLDDGRYEKSARYFRSLDMAIDFYNRCEV